MSSGSVDLLEASINATGSLLSILGTGFIIICYIILPTRKHIRHAFILNLTIAGMFKYLKLNQDAHTEVFRLYLCG